MSKSFSEIILTDADVFLDTFGTSVTYKKGDETTRSIQGIVIYQTEDSKDEQIHAKYPVLSLWVKNDMVEGISSSELDTGKDKVLLSPRQKVEEKWFRIVRILSQDNGMIELEIR